MKRILVEDRIKGIRKFMLLDDDDFEKFKRPPKSNRPIRGKCSLTVRKNGSMYAKTGKGWVHRLVLNLPSSEKRYVDHINRNTLDNRKCNLRLVTPTQNQWNRIRNRNKKEPQGVYLVKGKYYYSAITIGGKPKYLGSFKTLKLASLAYQRAKSELMVV